MMPAALVVVIALPVWMAIDRGASDLPPLALAHTGVEGPVTLTDARGRPMIANLRTVEPGRLYRGSAFPLTHPTSGGGTEYADESAFAFLRARDVRQVVVLHDDEAQFYAEEGYLRYWSEQTGYAIRVLWLPVSEEHLYGYNDRSALHAAAEFIARMREWEGDGAVYLHGRDGIHATGVVSAAYELWRNRAESDRAATWQAITARYLAANDTMRAAATTPRRRRLADCDPASGQWVCASTLDRLRRDLEFIVRL